MFLNVIVYIVSLIFCAATTTFASEEITPYKYTDQERAKGLAAYEIPQKARFTTKRLSSNVPDIVYYTSKPNQASFPIAILCTGSSSKDDIISVIHVHRYFLKELLGLGVAVLTVEQWGVDGNKINADEFIKHYTRSQRLLDHKMVINHLVSNPPKGWDGKLIFIGASEGGLLVTTLTTQYNDITLATINWSGAGDWPWREELWSFIQGMDKNMPWYTKWRTLLPHWMPFAINLNLPKFRKEYDQIMDDTIANPTADKEFMGMTYKYHADALAAYPLTDYNKIRTPFLVVAGAQDTIIQSCDKFVEKAKEAGAPVTYMRIPDMDHYVRKRPEVIIASFRWLKKQLIFTRRLHWSFHDSSLTGRLRHLCFLCV